MSFRSRIHVFALSAVLLAGCSSQGTMPTAAKAASGNASAKSVLAKTVTVEWMTNMLMTDHDANESGTIDITPGGIFSKKMNEAGLRAAGVDFLNWQHKKKFFVDADADKDQKVTRAEVEAKIKTYDVDGDGQLKARGAVGALKKQALGELDKLDKDYHINAIVAFFTQLI